MKSPSIRATSRTLVKAISFYTALSASVCNAQKAAPIPDYINAVAKAYRTDARALYALALVNSGHIVAEGNYAVAWPWTVYPNGKAVKLKDQIELIRYLTLSPETAFGLYALTLDDFTQNNLPIDDLYQVTSPQNQVLIVGKHFDAASNRWLADVAANYAIPQSRPQQPIVIPPTAQNINRLIAQSAQKYGVPVSLIKAVIRAESAFNTKAVSHAGALGLMQVMPNTARSLGVDPKHLFNPAVAIDTGTRYLAMQLRDFGDVSLALAAYNAGPGAVKKYGYTVPPYRETQAYVRRVSRYMRHYQKIGQKMGRA